MELIFKLPAGKPPFIGVCFKDGDPHPALVNQDLLDLYDPEELAGKVIVGKKARLYLYRHWPKEKRIYDALSFLPDKLKLFKSKANASVNFGHVQESNMDHVIVKSARKQKNFVIRLSQITFEFVED